MVTFNYRLSALGFLYLPEAGIYGNAALKDQVSLIEPIVEPNDSSHMLDSKNSQFDTLF